MLDSKLGWAQTENSIAHQFERTGGIDMLEEIQKSENTELYRYAYDLTQKFFPSFDDSMDTGPQPGRGTVP